jgi:hypothetical protein
LRVLKDRFGHHGIGLNRDFDLRSFFELYLLPTRVSQCVRNSDFSIKVIRTLDRDLSFFWFTGTGMRMNNFFDLAWERGTRFRLCTGHNLALHSTHTHIRLTIAHPAAGEDMFYWILLKWHRGNTVDDKGKHLNFDTSNVLSEPPRAVAMQMQFLNVPQIQ